MRRKGCLSDRRKKALKELDMAKDLVYDVYRHCTVYKRINNVTRSEMTETLFASSAMPLAYSPVDISGVDTSGLAVLKESEKIELLKKLRAGISRHGKSS